MFHSFFQNGRSHFSVDFEGQEGVRIMHECALCNPYDSNGKRSHGLWPSDAKNVDKASE